MLFSLGNNGKCEEIRQYISVSSSASFERFVPHIRSAEELYILPLLGEPLYHELQELYDLGFESESIEAGLLHKVQHSVIHLAFLLGFDVLNYFVSDEFKRTENEKFKGLFRYQEENLKRYFRRNGFNGLDRVLGYLESHIDLFEGFKESATYRKMHSSVIGRTSDFDSIVSIKGSRLTFIRVQPFMERVLLDEISNSLGGEFIDWFVDELEKDGDRDEAVENLRKELSRPVAFFASAALMEETGAQLDENGLFFDSYSGTDPATGKVPAELEQVGNLVKRQKEYGLSSLGRVKRYLKKHAADYPHYKGSGVGTGIRNNSGKRTFVAG